MKVLLSGVLGALLVFLLGIFREWWRNEQERRGLLRLLLSEVRHNAELVALVRKSGEETIRLTDIAAMKAEIWRESRARAARLLPPEMLLDLDSYYSRLETLLSLRRLTLSAEMMQGRWTLAVIEGKMDEEVQWSTSPTTWYLARTLEAEDIAQSSIKGYLEKAPRPRLWGTGKVWGTGRGMR
jgi:hypothetical protein